jgi:hypothetical protein
VSQEQASYRCIERLLDPTDALRQLVRFLKVVSFKGDEASLYMNTQLLLASLNTVQKLDSFRYANLPLSFLQSFRCIKTCSGRDTDCFNLAQTFG